MGLSIKIAYYSGEHPKALWGPLLFSSGCATERQQSFVHKSDGGAECFPATDPATMDVNVYII